MIELYRWDGRYFGFIGRTGAIFDAAGRYLGWVGSDGLAWSVDGVFLGELVDDNYLLRFTFATVPESRPARPVPPSPAAPARPADRDPRPPASGFVDALDQFP